MNRINKEKERFDVGRMKFFLKGKFS